MASINANVQRLFIATASFIANSVRGQFGYDKTLKQLNIHNDTDDTIASTFSDDSKQLLLASTQTVTGDKTFTGAANFDGAVDFDSTVDFTGATVSGLTGFVTTNTDQTITGIKTIDNDFVIRDGNTLLMKDIGDATTATIWNDGNRVVVDGVAAIRLNPTGSGIIDVTTSVTATGNNATINAISGAATITSTTGTVVSQDVNSTANLTLKNADDTNASTINNAEIDVTLTQDLASGGLPFDGLKVLVEKTAAWAASTGLASKVTFQARQTDTISSYMQQFLKYDDAGATILGDENGLGSIKIADGGGAIGTGNITINAGDSGDGVVINIAGVEFMSLIEGGSSGVTIAAGAGNFNINAPISSPIGIFTAPTANAAVRISPIELTGTTQYGLVVNNTSTNGATAETTGVYCLTQTAAAAYTCSATHGILIDSIVKGAGSTITNNYGLRIQDQNVAGATNYAIYTNAGTVRFGDTVNLNPLTASTALALDASKNIVSVTNTGSGNNVLSASPTLTGTIGAASMTLSGTLAVTGTTTHSESVTINNSKELIFIDELAATVGHIDAATGNLIIRSEAALVLTSDSLAGGVTFSGTAATYSGNSVSLTATSTTVTITGPTGISTVGKVTTSASSTAKAGLNLPSGTAPTSPVDGDMWYDGTNIKFRVGGTTKVFTLV